MSLLDEIKRMKQEGRSEQEVVQLLQQRGASRAEIENALSHTQIKEAVTASSQDSYSNNSAQSAGYDFEGSGQIPTPDFNSLQPSLMAVQDEGAQDNTVMPVPSPSPDSGGSYQPDQYSAGGGYQQEGYSQEGYQDQSYPQESYPPESYPEQQGYDNQQYAQYQQSAVSTDTITEIAEQVVSEKLAKLRGQLEKATDGKGMADGKLSQLDERLQRIEKIIDRLQLSVLQKIGDYVTDVSDLKKELVETQKSFKVLSGRHHSHGSSEHVGEHHSHHHHSHPSHEGHSEHHKKHGKK